MLMKFPTSMRPLSYISVIKFKFKIAEPFLGPLIFLLILDVVQAFPGAPTFSGSINLTLGYTSDEGNSHKIVMVRYDDDRIYPISQENLKRHLKQCRPYDINYFPPEKLRIIRIIKISQYEMAILSDFCVSHESKMSFHIIQDVTSSQLTGGIVPGTKWCGKGNIASFPEDLGVFSHLDKCCCDHDNCPDIIRAKEARYGLRNTADYTLLSCDCDEKFRECLANVKKTNATLMERMITRIVGITFFDCFGATCFKEEYPIKCCKHRKPLFSSKCSEYKFDRTRAKFHQLLDPKDYIGGDIVHIVNTGCEKMVPLTPWDKQVPTKSNVPDCDKSDMVDDETYQGYDEEDEQAEKIYLEDLKPSNNFHTISHVDLEFIKPLTQSPTAINLVNAGGNGQSPVMTNVTNIINIVNITNIQNIQTFHNASINSTSIHIYNTAHIINGSYHPQTSNVDVIFDSMNNSGMKQEEKYFLLELRYIE